MLRQIEDEPNKLQVTVPSLHSTVGVFLFHSSVVIPLPKRLPRRNKQSNTLELSIGTLVAAW